MHFHSASPAAGTKATAPGKQATAAASTLGATTAEAAE